MELNLKNYKIKLSVFIFFLLAFDLSTSFSKEKGASPKGKASTTKEKASNSKGNESTFSNSKAIELVKSIDERQRNYGDDKDSALMK